MASDAVLATLDHIWGVLEPLGYPMALMGGVSLAAWGHVRATRDVDLLIAVDESEVDTILYALGANGCRPKKSPPVVLVGDHRFVQLLYTPSGEFYDVQLDLLLAESELQRSAIARRVSREAPGMRHPIDVLDCADLILFKLLAGRMIDRADAAMLLRENREALEVSYLLSWVNRLGLGDEFAQSWSEAFPNQPPLELPAADGES